MNISMENKIKKSIKNLDYAMEILNKDYIAHFSEPSLEEINKSYDILKSIAQQLIDSNFGQLKKIKE